ncbi:MAG: hypothetical protein M3N46_12950 [Actinomycetota bacterium]|nr:hypothetical protein [Actinomycetota bacterium]
MSTIKNPVGPQPPSVYWRRRLLLIAVLLAIVIVVVLIIVRPGSGGTKTPTGSQTSGQADSPSPSFTAGTGGSAAACAPSVITLAAVTDAISYAAGVQPKLSMTITNGGANACTIDVGTDAQVYTITSGSDQIWSSADCQTDKTALKQVLQPGVAKALSTTPFAWDRTRSSTTTCTGTRPAVTAGGASYHLNVKLGSLASKSSKQFLLQ